MADILIISDFCFGDPFPDTMKRLKTERDKGTRLPHMAINLHN